MSYSQDGFREVSECYDVDARKFHDILAKGEPVLLKNCNFGTCTRGWTWDYLKNKLDNDQIISIHESRKTDLQFIEKNFKYRNCKISEFLDRLLDSESNVYLRSTNRDPRSKKPARIETDFPTLTADLNPPVFIPFGSENNLYHSSVLRIASAGIQIWTHFDLYDNVLLQIVGTKRVVLISPEDSKYLYIRGDKSLVNEFEDWQMCLDKYPLMRHAKPYKCLLKPAECLFIPSLWWHNIRTLNDASETSATNHSIGLNIFWRDQTIASGSFYADNDVYGNKNLIPFELASSHLNKFFQHLNKLPGKYKVLYKAMLMEKIQQEFSSCVIEVEKNLSIVSNPCDEIISEDVYCQNSKHGQGCKLQCIHRG